MMKKFATGFLAAALSLGLAACTEEEAAVGEAEDLNQLESPAAGDQPLTTDPAYDQGIGREEGLIQEEERLGTEEPMGSEDQLIEEEFDPQDNQGTMQ